MSENKYTPEPWRTDAECGFPQDIHDSKGNLFLRCSSDFDNEVYGEANARRIVACVNACAGCATEVLETAPVGFFNSTYGHPKYLEEITKQRDELLAAMTRCYKMLLSEPDTQGALFKAENILREAIADAN